MDNDVDSLTAKVEKVSSHAFAFAPLPWRVVFLIGTTILGWATNLHFLHFLKIDAAYALDMYSHSPYSHPGLPSDYGHLYRAIYRIFAAYSAWSLGCWLFFRALCGGDIEMMDHYKIVPQFCIIVIFIVLVCPFNIVRKRERDIFLRALHRCLYCSTKRPVFFSDVVLADMFTSLAKVFGDIWVSVCMLAPSGSLLAPPTHGGWTKWVSPLMMSFPYLVRFQQCMIEFLSSPYRSEKKAFMNAIKYASAFPVIFLSFVQRQVPGESTPETSREGPAQEGYQVFRVWLLAVVINSGFSFWWDVTNDWGLSLLSFDGVQSSEHLLRPSSFDLPTTPVSPVWTSTPDEAFSPRVSAHTQLQRHPRGLRPVLLFNDPFLYYASIGLNLILRLTWSLKLSSHLHTLANLESGIFLVEALEILRRWVWVFFRIEWELVRKTGIGPSTIDQHELVDLSDGENSS